MATASQKNKEHLIRIEGEIALLKHEIQTSRGNPLVHLDQRVSRMEKVMWSICLIAATHLIYTLLQ